MSKSNDLNVEIRDLLEIYEKEDAAGVDAVRKFLASKGDDWDRSVINSDGVKIDDITLLFIYEYAVSNERVTAGKISFESTLKGLEKLDKFRLGEPKKGDEEITYGKSFDDETAMSIVSDQYDLVRKSTGAQHADYIDSKGNIKDNKNEPDELY